MACPMCPLAAGAGGWVGGFFGIYPPDRPGGRIFSALITANLVSITVIALKVIFDVSICGGGGVTLKNTLRVALTGLMLGIIYSIGVNYLLGRCVFPAPVPAPVENEEAEPKPHACCKNKRPIDLEENI